MNRHRIYIYDLLGLVVALCVLFAGDLGAAEIKTIDNRIFVSGTLNPFDGEKLQQSLQSSPKVEEVIFENSPGGSLATALEFAKLIRQRKLNTVVKGKCYSACAYAFLAGQVRTFDSGAQLNGLMLHVGRITKDGKERESSENDKIMLQLDEMTGNQIPDSIKALIRKSWKESEGVLIVSQNYFLWRREEVMFCDGTQGLDASRCTRIPGTDAKTLGILTK